MTLHAQRPITVFIAALALAIFASVALAAGDQPTPNDLAKYGWGAAATLAKSQKTSIQRSVRGNQPTPAVLAKYGWGAAATYAKAQKNVARPVTRADRLTQAELAKYGWGAAATYAKAQRAG